MKNKKWLLLLIIAFPSLFWLILETSTIQSSKLPYYGPKLSQKAGDTSYYTVNTSFYPLEDKQTTGPSVKAADGAFILSLLHPKYLKETYRLEGFWEYLNYKTEKIAQIPFVFLIPSETDTINIPKDLKEFKPHQNIQFLQWKVSSYDSLWKTYFTEKPYYIDYSFFVLIDGQSHVRGYYDIRYASEMKRLIEEYKHLRLKEEKQKLIESNEIKSRT
ncbi:MAG: hypothetical protein JNK73_06870 [Bacteroidia bacterium]|nr:hypothetical protein [Bacteroidia bacterium]